MRTSFWLLPSFAALFVLGACSSSSTTTPTGEHGDASASQGSSSSGSASTKASGGSSTTHAATSSSTNSSAFDWGCTSPAKCGASEVCCGSIPLSGGASPQCNVYSLQTECASASSCPSQLSPTASECQGTNHVRLCASNADCTEKTFTSCCHFTEGSASINFCFAPVLAQYANATCMGDGGT